ncbi:MAG TPA: chorismate mutase, partial [Gammaproteobacteria bacterium]|nr:chorismate mutase [Gammaproteobacteria bacterium]
MADDAKQLHVLRGEIDAIDLELLRLINARAALAIEIATAKRDSGAEGMFYRPEREAVILRRILERSPGPMSSPEATRLLREIMSACLALEHPLGAAYLGPEGTYTHLAALKHFGGSIEAKPFSTIEEVMREVETGNVDYGVV